MRGYRKWHHLKHPAMNLQVCKHFAAKLLTCGRQLATSDFLNKLKEIVPEGMEPGLEGLKGEVLTIGKKSTQVLRAQNAAPPPGHLRMSSASLGFSLK
jgi:hypothetical protein